MSVHRWIILALCLAVPAVSYRAGGSALWAVHGTGCLLAAGLALWLLHEDGLLVGALKYRSADLTIAIVAAGLVYLPIAALFQLWIAPIEGTNSLLRLCSARGAWIPRPEARGLGLVAEWLRDRSCAAFHRSAGVRGWQRGALIVLVAAAEEVAWRAGVQRMLAERLGKVRGWLAAAALFGLAHLGTGNPAVALLALAAGLVFGGLYIVRASPVPDNDDEAEATPSFGTMHLGAGRLIPCVAAHCAFSFYFFYWHPLLAIRSDGVGG